MGTRIVFQNDGTVPVEDILCTTYQMRNFYQQFRDGFFSDLDVMNYIQHLAAVRMMKKGYTVLDVCCGRSLLLPLMRYHAKDVRKYIGVDIEPSNCESRTKDVRTGKPVDVRTHYPFATEWVFCNVAEMATYVPEKVDFIVYTSSIEHMHKVHGEASVFECAKLLKPGKKMFLSCPNTPEDQDGYDVRYKAHVYEWKLSELRSVLARAGFVINREVGLVGSVRDLDDMIVLRQMSPDMYEFFQTASSYLPREFLKPLMFFHMPEKASEVLLVCTRRS